MSKIYTYEEHVAAVATRKAEIIAAAPFKIGDIVTPCETKTNAKKADFHESMTGHTSVLRPGTVGIIESVYLLYPSSRCSLTAKPRVVYRIAWEAANGATKISHRVSKSAIKLVK